mmetsp:Transcript_48617/g.71257  ORF Transcript_48617/g.71257 Transcript_48617/m.71257 type:complete len:88 (+) Transcript_48617:295-558(+)
MRHHSRTSVTPHSHQTRLIHTRDVGETSKEACRDMRLRDRCMRGERDRCMREALACSDLMSATSETHVAASEVQERMRCIHMDASFT